MKFKIKKAQPKPLKKTTLNRFLKKRMLIYLIPNVFFNFIIAYASFNELGYTHFFACTQSLARLTLPMAIFLPVVLTIDIIKRVTDAAHQKAIEFEVDDQLNLKKLLTKLSILNGLVTGVLVLSSLLFAQFILSKYYKLNPTAMAILVGSLAGILSVLFTYLPIRTLKNYLNKRVILDSVEVNNG
ncbi:hypothetical protein [Chryseobacterium geocarposphaerae]|uniref:Uncharacterized protein n=1 Tax=Chryseobacterium geocarposphaerae TaxID=1416776 RepID=A0A2M9C6T5_9FLAO|nr:hypothetical protein [Chryseobacterium geocarposphaerae]PJJ66561.1 hypothetical protein CLV73_0548 [Chryseobacterium geocarposphaerae]